MKRKQRIEITAYRRQLSVYSDIHRAKDADAPSQTQEPAEPAQHAAQKHQGELIDFAHTPDLTRLIETMLEANDTVPTNTEQPNDYGNSRLRQLGLTLRRLTRRFEFSSRNSLLK